MKYLNVFREMSKIKDNSGPKATERSVASAMVNIQERKLGGMEIKKAVLDKGQLVANKAKDLAEIAKLKSQIFSCEEVIRKNQLEIGNMVYADYEAWKEARESGDELNPEPFQGKTECEKQCVAIANAKRAIADLKKQIKAIQGK